MKKRRIKMRMAEKRAIAFFATSSHAGKSLITLAFCRILANKGIKVAPFKAQNMSLNSMITEKGKEIATAQYMQAIAAKTKPKAEMNPILLKPKGNGVSQVIIKGEPYKDMAVEEYYRFAESKGIKVVEQCIKELYREYDFLVIEGAGSCAEINLESRDIANFRTAKLANADVYLVADIDRGGVFAGIYGTISLLNKKESGMVKGIIINKFRGDAALLENGIKKIEKLTRKKIIGIVPYIDDLFIPSEDSVSLNKSENTKRQGRAKIKIAVIKLPFISNFTDFESFKMHDNVELIFASHADEIRSADAIIIPGTKNTVKALKWLQEKKLMSEIKKKAGRVPIVGICGGLQILGKEIIDNGIEGDKKKVYKALGLLEIRTIFEKYRKDKKASRYKIIASNGMLRSLAGKKVSGYEIHMGRTEILENAKQTKAAIAMERGEIKSKAIVGACDNLGIVFGSYIHGFFDDERIRNAFISFVAKNKIAFSRTYQRQRKPIKELLEDSIERVAKTIEESIDLSFFSASNCSSAELGY